MAWATPDLVGKPVVNGCGALLGRVVGVAEEMDGIVREIVVRQLDGSKDWFIDAIHIRSVAERVQLKGPREGFHIAPMPPEAPAEAAPVAAAH